MSNNRLYNYLVNNYGLSKEKVLKTMEDRFKKLELDVHIEANRNVQRIFHEKCDQFLNSYNFQKSVQNSILNILEHGFKPQDWKDKRVSLETFIKNRVSELIQKEVEKQWKEMMKDKLKE